MLPITFRAQVAVLGDLQHYALMAGIETVQAALMVFLVSLVKSPLEEAYELIYSVFRDVPIKFNFISIICAYCFV